MKSTLTNTTLYAAAIGVLTSPAFADPGHIEEAGGDHTHLLALGAVSLAVLIGGWLILRAVKLRKLKADKSS